MYRNINVSNWRIKWEKTFILRGFFSNIIRPSKEVPIQSKLLKHKNKVWKLWRIKNEGNDVVSVPFFVTCEHISNVLIFDFEHANVCRLHIEKMSTFTDKIGYIICYVVVY